MTTNTVCDHCGKATTPRERVTVNVIDYGLDFRKLRGETPEPTRHGNWDFHPGCYDEVFGPAVKDLAS